MWPFRKSLTQLAANASDQELVEAIRERSPRDLSKHTALQRGVHAVRWLKAEVNNGGLEQYFTNSTADDYPLLCHFLQDIEATDTLQALTSYGRHFETGHADASFPERRARIDIVSKQEEIHGEAWASITRDATEAISQTFSSLTAKLAHYIRRNIGKAE